MSNETDLDWLARHVHVWPTNTPKAILPGDATFKLGAVFYGDCVAFSGEIGPEYRRVNKADWLARRAELQNKPDWSKAEEWAEWLAQDSYGCWGFFQKKPLMHALSWIARSGYYQIHSPGNLFLGDWRDTLEKRPEQAEFEPFVSVEDAKITIMQSDGDVKNFGGIIGRSLPLKEDATTAKQPSITPSKYTKTIHGVSVDVYDVLMAWGVTNPALQHLIKKALQCGQRGHKDNEQDLQDIIDSAIRAKELG